MKLVTNAIKFTEKGSIVVKAENAEEKQNKMIVKITVSDIGIGIPEDKQGEIYVRFSQLLPACRGIHKGLGLGLSLVKEFIDDLGGELYVESKVGVGSSFYCLLPLEPALLDTPEFVN